MNYCHLTIEERSCIFQFRKLGMSIREIGDALHRSPSTISRELKRNSYKSGEGYIITLYNPVNAQKKYEERRQSCHRKTGITEEIEDYLRDRIEEHWSPEQIANRPEPSMEYIPSTSTIYRYIHEHRIKRIHMKHLRRKGTFKRPAETRGRFNDKGRTIRKRPADVYRREEIGHWEGDTVESGRIDRKKKSKYCFVTLAERKSRKYLAVLVPTRTAEHVTAAIINALKDFPDEMVKTITFDRGKEFSGFEDIEKALNCKTYFCDPYCAWQKGTNENSNGLLREFYPKGMDLSEVDTTELINNLNLLNNRPRKCLNYKTPNEVFG